MIMPLKKQLDVLFISADSSIQAFQALVAFRGGAGGFLLPWVFPEPQRIVSPVASLCSSR